MAPNKPEKQRPLAWEDDFSRNALDDAPFSNVVNVAELDWTRLENLFNKYVDEDLRLDLDLRTLVAADIFPIPHDDDRESYSRGNHEWFWLSGLIDWLKVRHGIINRDFEPQSVLEMGAASGRVLRHLSAQGKFPELWAFDINYRHVRWVSQFLDPAIRCFHNYALPHLPIADKQLDMVTAFSVFTHIDTFETAWIAELFRIMKPGGMAWLTFQTEHTWDSLKDTYDNDLRLGVLKETTWYRPEMLDAPMPGERLVCRHSQVGPYRGMVFHHSDYLRRTWGPWFEIVEMLPLYHGKDQTVCVMKRLED